MKVNDSEDLISYDCVTNMNGKGIEGPEGYGFFILFKDNYNNLELLLNAYIVIERDHLSNPDAEQVLTFGITDDHFTKYYYRLKQHKLEVNKDDEE